MFSLYAPRGRPKQRPGQFDPATEAAILTVIDEAGIIAFTEVVERSGVDVATVSAYLSADLPGKCDPPAWLCVSTVWATPMTRSRLRRLGYEPRVDRLRRLAREARDAHDPRGGTHQRLGVVELAVLGAIERAGDWVSASEIAKATGYAPNTVSAALWRLTHTAGAPYATDGKTRGRRYRATAATRTVARQIAQGIDEPSPTDRRYTVTPPDRIRAAREEREAHDTP